MQKLYLGIDLGGTQVKMAVVTGSGKIVERSVFQNHNGSVPKEIAGQIIEQARKMKNFKKVCCTGIGVAGDIDQKNGIVRFSPNLNEWRNVPLKKMLTGQLPKPIIIDNDANVAALGAYWLEAKGRVKNLICITLGTGVGGGIICEGKLYRGASGSAGEIGHMSFEPYGPKCNCGSAGCIERYVGAYYLSEQARREVKQGRSQIISNLVNGRLENITPEILTKAANQGDPVAKEIWQMAGERLGIVLSGVINLLNPEMIVLAGGMSLANELLLDPIKKTVSKRSFNTPAKTCRIIISQYNEKLGMVGAALLSR